ncbi:hypothetical protein F3Y22_tig00116989pilonHSYRG00679 [Hibiscus syriacus]|uniref:Uncharacterized protein n=1 Tax=Hibiscus syriacus TaxID=106335 RepID=A0A6A2WFP4_HIBSY|nr:hypothetical protein F3Y22_tig00116989pilonHSYRG00679 [Hibiscus syriacus]
MADASIKAISLEETPTWDVAVVCFVLLVVSIFIEHAIHILGKLRDLLIVAFNHPFVKIGCWVDLQLTINAHLGRRQRGPINLADNFRFLLRATDV